MQVAASLPPMPIPPAPDVPDAQRSHARVWLRYEDLCQDGRLTMQGIPHTLAEVFWRQQAALNALDEPLRRGGVVPILTRLCTQGGDGPLSVDNRIEAEGRYQIARVDDERGEVERLVLAVWVELSGPRGSTHGPPPPGAGEPIAAGRMFAEHVFTRPFAPAAERKVTRLVGSAQPQVPDDRYRWHTAASLLELPAGAQPLDDLSLDGQGQVFGLDHTDANQHVNSLVYPRLFAEAALRRLGALGCGGELLVRYQETAFRKPCFAGQHVRIALRCFRLQDELGAVVALFDAALFEAGERAGVETLSSQLSRAHAYGLMRLQWRRE